MAFITWTRKMLHRQIYCLLICSFKFPSVYAPSHLFHLQWSISLALFTLVHQILTLFGYTPITSSFNLDVTIRFQPTLSLKINALGVTVFRKSFNLR